MRSAFGKAAVLACALAVANAGLAWGQGVFSFSDNFNDREVWDNAQTNAFLPAWASVFVPVNGDPPIPFNAELRVVGQQVTLLVNGVNTASFVDPDLQVGTVGVLSWGERAGAIVTGMQNSSFELDDGVGAPVFTGWAGAVANWHRVKMKNRSNVVFADNVADNMGIDPTTGWVVEDSNGNTSATGTALNQDFMGPAIAYTPGGTTPAWTDYEARARFWANDNDGMGLLFRMQNDTTFYRVTFHADIPTAVGNTRPPWGISVQKCLTNANPSLAPTWSELYRDNQTAPFAGFVYGNKQPFDVSVKVSTVAGATKINIHISNKDPAATTPEIDVPEITDSTNPILSGTVGVHSWGQDLFSATATADYRGMRVQTFGGTPGADFVRTLDAVPTTLAGDVFVPYSGWVNTWDGTPAYAGFGPFWHVRVRDGVLSECSDGRFWDGGTSNGGPDCGDGQYKPWVIVQGPLADADHPEIIPFSTGPNYTVKATLSNVDDDGLGIVFGFKDYNNYFRVGWRSQTNTTTPCYGFRQGTQIQKVVNGVITQIFTVPEGGSGNLAGIWIKKLNTGAIEQVDASALRDGSGQNGVEFTGPRLVGGDVNWTDYTFQYVSEVRDNWGFGPLFRYQDQQNYYRLTFSGQDFTPTGPPIGLSIQKVVNGVYTELWKDTDLTASGDNGLNTTVSNGIGFVYGDTQSPATFRIWRTRVILSGSAPLTIRIEIDGIAEDGSESPNYYVATITDPAPLTHGKVGFHTWAQTANEFRDISVTLAGQNTPVFVDAIGNVPDPRGWVDATAGLPSNYDQGGVLAGDQTGTGTTGTAAGAPISGFGIRIDLNALGVRDNRYKSGTVDSVLETGTGTGTINFDGPRAVVGQPNWKDYTYDVDMRQFDDDGTGVVFRYQDENNFYRLMFMSQSGNTLGPPPRGVSVQKRLNGTFSELFFTTNFIYTPGQRWHTQVVATGSHFDIHITEIDGPRIGQVHNYSFDDATNPLLTGKIGVTVWGSNGAANKVNTLDGLPAPGLDWTQNFDESGVFDNVAVSGTLGRLPPDLNHDGMINNTDYILWQQCFSGPNVPRTDNDANCDVADEDFDGDIDADDFAWFQRCYSGSAALDPTCVN